MSGSSAKPPRCRWFALATLCCLLVILIAGSAILYPLAVRPRFPKADQALVDRTIISNAKMFRADAQEVRRRALPAVLHIGRKTCVNLSFDGGGNYYACYDRSGKLVEERSTVD